MVLTKTCSKCKSVLPIDFFCLKSDHSTGFDPQCRDCKGVVRGVWLQTNPRDSYMKAYAESKKDQLRAYKHNHYINNRDRNSEKRRVYAANNKERFRPIVAKYQRDRRRNNIAYRILMACRGRIWYALKSGKKAAPTVELIGCEIGQLKSHLENQFKPGMNWGNYGEWHIDHILPCASFDLTDLNQQRTCFNYTNLQPLWRIENIKKGAKVPYG